MRVRSDRVESLASPAFIAALALLVVNDFALKPLFHNALTGKLSDFAGLFALTLFVVTLWPQQRRLAACVIALSFTFWKTTYAEPLIEAWNAVAPFAFARTVDLTDLVALPMIPLAVWAAPRLTPWPLSRSLQLCLAVLAPIAFTATSRGQSQIRATAELPASTAVDEVALQSYLDDVAQRHGMECTICDPIGEGRLYRDPRERSLVVNFAADRNELYFAALDSPRRAGERALARLQEDIRTGLEQRFPGVTISEETSSYDDPLEVTSITWQIADGGPASVEVAESARRALSSIVEEVVRAHGLKPERYSYYAGRRRSWNDWDLVVSPNYAGNDTLGVGIRYYNDAYEPLYRAVAIDLAGRLRTRFGPENVKYEVR